MISRINSIIFFLVCLTHIKSHSQAIQNPIIEDYIYHDSSLIDGKDGFYYSFVSSIVPRDTTDFKHYYTVSIFRSNNLTDWKFYKYALSKSDIQQEFLNKYDKEHKLSGKYAYIDSTDRKHYYALWAPDIMFFNNKYLLFVTLRRSVDDTKIALFSSNSLSEDFHFENIIISNNPADKDAYFYSKEQIDPFPIVDGEHFYLTFGSFTNSSNGLKLASRKGMGVYIVELDSKNNFKMKEIPQFLTNLYEGVIILKRKKEYCLLGSNGSIRNYTYKISYAKSKHIKGPYLNNEGKSIADTINANFGTPILQTSLTSRFNGFGCPSLPIKDKKGRLWMLIFGHAPEYPPIREKNAKEERYTFLVELFWDKNNNPWFNLDAIQNNQQPSPTF